MIYVIIILTTIVLSAFFSSSETALMKLNKTDLEDKSLSRIQKEILEYLIKKPSELLVTILIGNNLVNILGTAVASVFFVSLFGEKIGLTASTIFMTCAVLVFAEITPKAIASGNPVSVAKLVSVPLYVIHKIATPVNFTFKKTINPLIERFNKNDHDRDALLQEIYTGIHQVVSKESDAIDVISSTIEASDLTVKDIMTNRANIMAYSENMELERLYNEMLSTRYTRFPIYRNTLDHIVGIIHLKDIVNAKENNVPTPQSLYFPVQRFPENTPIIRALRGLQETSVHMAIVKDEFGNTSGLITLEDIMEEFFGQIRDEYDDEEFENIKMIRDFIYDSRGDISVKDFNEETGFDIDAPDAGTTLAGLILDSLSRIPKKGETIAIGSFLFKVSDIENNKIIRVRIEKIVR